MGNYFFSNFLLFCISLNKLEILLFFFSCGLGDDDGDGAQATTNDVESEDIFDSAEKPQNQVCW